MVKDQAAVIQWAGEDVTPRLWRVAAPGLALTGPNFLLLAPTSC
jgi:hypothetical protein